MVDFNNETTVSTPAVDIVRVLILQRHNDLIEAFEHINKLEGLEQSDDIQIIRARMFSLYLQISEVLTRQLKPEEMTEFKRRLKDGTMAELTESIIKINEVLDAIKLTRVDTKKVYDPSRVEVENELKEL